MFARILLIFLLLTRAISMAQNPESALQLAREKAKQKKYREAVIEYDKVLSKQKDNFIAYAERGQAKYEMGKKEDAYKDFDKAVALNKDYFQSLMVRASAHEKDGNFARAIEDYTRVIQVNPANTEAPVLRGMALIKLGKYREAEKDFDATLSRSTRNFRAYLGKAFIAEKEKRYEEAINHSSKAIEFNKNAAEAYYCRARAQAALKKSQASLTDFAKAIALGESGEPIWLDYANAALACGNQEVIQSCLQTLTTKLKSKNSKISYIRAQAAFIKNDFGTASREYTKIITTDAKSIKAYLERGKCYYLMGAGKYPLALKDFQKATSLDPTSEEAWFGYGKMAFESNQFDLGSEALSRAISIKQTAEAYYLRSKCFYKLKRQKECCADLRKSLEMGMGTAQKDIDRVCR
jgi:tetratricopeptide (TPR) repeat protein